MIPFNIYIQLWVKSIFVYAWKYCTNLYSELLEIMDTQWGISKSVTSANSVIWTKRCLMAIAISRAVLNYSSNKWPVATSLTRRQRDHPPEQPPPRRSRRGRVRPRAWKHLARKALVAWDQCCKIRSPVAMHPPSSPAQGASHAEWEPWLLCSLEFIM